MGMERIGVILRVTAVDGDGKDWRHTTSDSS